MDPSLSLGIPGQGLAGDVGRWFSQVCPIHRHLFLHPFFDSYLVVSLPEFRIVGSVWPVDLTTRTGFTVEVIKYLESEDLPTRDCSTMMRSVAPEPTRWFRSQPRTSSHPFQQDSIEYLPRDDKMIS